jgi:hypothetical protein
MTNGCACGQNDCIVHNIMFMGVLGLPYYAGYRGKAVTEIAFCMFTGPSAENKLGLVGARACTGSAMQTTPLCVGGPHDRRCEKCYFDFTSFENITQMNVLVICITTVSFSGPINTRIVGAKAQLSCLHQLQKYI